MFCSIKFCENPSIFDDIYIKKCQIIEKHVESMLQKYFTNSFYIKIHNSLAPIPPCELHQFVHHLLFSQNIFQGLLK